LLVFSVRIVSILQRAGSAQIRTPNLFAPIPQALFARPWGSLPKGCNKMRSDRSATAPGLGISFIERQQGIPIDQRLSLGLEQTVL